MNDEIRVTNHFTACMKLLILSLVILSSAVFAADEKKEGPAGDAQPVTDLAY